jgi:hypothetical protein
MASSLPLSVLIVSVVLRPRFNPNVAIVTASKKAPKPFLSMVRWVFFLRFLKENYFLALAQRAVKTQ